MKVIKRGINLDVSPIIGRSLLKKIHDFDAEKYNIDFEDLTEGDLIEINQYWTKFLDLSMLNLGWFQFYYSITRCHDFRFIPDDLFYTEIDRVLNSPFRAWGLDDKNLYSRIFCDVKQPETLVSKMGSVLLNGRGDRISVDDAISICVRAKYGVLKEAVHSCGGHGIKLLSFPEDVNKLKIHLNEKQDLIIQEKIKQHSLLKHFHPESVNTIRMMTYLRENGDAVVLSSVLRMGNGKSFTDNFSMGGCTCGINDNGLLNEFGISNDYQYIAQNSNGVVFKGKYIPSFSDIKKTAKRLHYQLPMFPLLAWDFSVDKTETPVLIEVNMCNASIDFMQLNNGPLFGEYTSEVLCRVYRNCIVK